MTEKEIKNRIYRLLKNYIRKINAKNNFIPGKTKIRYTQSFYDEEEIVAITETMLSGWFGLATKGEIFERSLADYLGAHSALLTNSGSSASLLALSTLTNDLFGGSVEPGSEVITPACTFATSVAAIVQRGLIPVFIDVDLGTYNINPSTLEKAITKKTRIIFIPHTLGNPNEMDRVMRIAREHKLYVIEDNCDALGSEYLGKKTGSFGTLATCSFYPAHHITTAGEGGAVIINHPQLHRIALTFRNWGRECWCSSQELDPNGACGKRFDFKLNGIPIDHKYYFTALGYNLKPVELQAAMGIVQLKKFPLMALRRRENFAILFNYFKKYERFFLLPHSLKKANPCWFSFALSLKDNIPFSRLDITRYLESQLIETRTVFAGNITRQPAMRGIKYRVVGRLNNSDKILKDTFFIGLGPHIETPHLTYIQEIFTNFLKKY